MRRWHVLFFIVFLPWVMGSRCDGTYFNVSVSSNYTGCQDPNLVSDWKVEYTTYNGGTTTQSSSTPVGETTSDVFHDAGDNDMDGFIDQVTVSIDLSCTKGLHSWSDTHLDNVIPATGTAAFTIGPQGQISYDILNGPTSSVSTVVSSVQKAIAPATAPSGNSKTPEKSAPSSRSSPSRK